MNRARLRVAEVFGLSPLGERLREARTALRGDPTTPPSKFDLTSLEQLTRLPGWKVWAGQRIYGRRVPISNLFNHEQPPPEEGWSVRVTRVRDFRGGRLTYDSHNGTDLVTPVGTEVVAAAPGRVLRVSREFDRGGLKVFVDHGEGLATSYNHLGRELVRVGDVVRRGQVIALSGYSGLDGLATFPFGIPHVHFNVWLDGVYVDPFAHDDAPSFFRTGNSPEPYQGTDDEARLEEVPPAGWDERGVGAAIAACIAPETRAHLTSIAHFEERAMAVLMHVAYFPTRFRDPPPLYERSHPRRPRLDLPFRVEDYDGIRFPDES